MSDFTGPRADVPCPSSWIAALVGSYADDRLLSHPIATLRRVAGGLLIGGGACTVLGVVIGRIERLRTVVAQYDASSLLVLRRVVLPGSLPVMLAWMRLAFNTALVMTMAVELIHASSRLGRTIRFAWDALRVDEM